MALHRAWLRCRLPGLLAALTLLLVATAASAQVQPSDPPYVPGEVLIGWTPGSGPLPLVTPVKEGFESDRRDAAALAARGELASLTGLQVLSALPAHGMARLAVAEGREAAEIARLQAAGQPVPGTLDTATVSRLFEEAVPDWMEFDYRVAELRTDWLTGWLAP